MDGSRMRRAALAAIALGCTVALVGLLGLVFSWGSSSPAKARQAISTTSAPEARQTLTANEQPSAFLSAFVSALRSGDTEFLFDRIDPALPERFGEVACRAAVGTLLDDTADLRLVDVSGPADFDYSAGDQSIVIPDTYTFNVVGTVHGQQVTRQYHMPMVDGRFRILVDCATVRAP